LVKKNKNLYKKGDIKEVLLIWFYFSILFEVKKYKTIPQLERILLS